MPCYSPITGYYSKSLNDSGKRPIVFRIQDGFADRPVKLPCGRCIGCRLEYSRQWAVRCVHEASLHANNAFITLTFDDEHYPADHSIHKEDLQKFFKRLRKNTKVKMRYFACGEYGEKRGRPHYHAIVFGYDFPDKVYWVTRNGSRLYRSAILEKTWAFGHSLIGDVTFESAAYVARYVVKKHKPDKRVKEEVNLYNSVVDPDTGEIFEINPEFCLMSRNPGLGAGWLERFKSDTDKDYITLNGKKMSLPKYYDSLLEKMDPEGMKERKFLRQLQVNEEEHTYRRLQVKEKVKASQIVTLTRDLEK